MIPDIGLMIGLYIITRMISFLTRKKERKENIVVLIFACITILVSIVAMADLFLKGTDFESLKLGGILPETEKTEQAFIESIEIPKTYLVITKPAELYKSDFQSTWSKERIPVGTKLEILRDHVWKSSATNLEISFLKVKYKGINGWVMEDYCRIIRE